MNVDLHPKGAALSWAVDGFRPSQEEPLAADQVAAVYLVADGAGRTGLLTIGHSPLPPAEYPAHQRWSQALRHASANPHLADVLAVGLTPDGRTYLVTATNTVLADNLHRSGPYTAGNATRLGADVADGLAAAHSLQLVHGALRPSTVQVADDGTGVLAGFNTLAPGLSVPIVVDSYTAPELIPPATRGMIAASPAADVYALAVTVWVALGGRLPWATTPSDPVKRMLPLPDIPGVAQELLAWLRAAASPDPARRPSALALRDALVAHAAAISARAPAGQDHRHDGDPKLGIELEFNLLEGFGIRVAGKRKVAPGMSLVVGVSLGSVGKGLVGILSSAGQSAMGSAAAGTGMATGSAAAGTGMATGSAAAGTGMATGSATAGSGMATGSATAGSGMATGSATAGSGAAAGGTATGVGTTKIVVISVVCAGAVGGGIAGAVTLTEPDYTNINVVTDRGTVGQPETQEIYIMKADGDDVRQLTFNDFREDDPDLFRDQQIAFMSERDGNAEIYVMNADGSEQQRLTRTPARDYCPDWSPDGTKIAFTSNRDGSFEIYVMNADGSQPRRLTTNQGWCPNWSPDGSKIAFTSNRDGNSEIYVMNPDGSHPQRLTTHPADDDSPNWSRDGGRIAFTSNRDGNTEIYLMNADGTAQSRLTDNPAEDYYPEWSPNGKKILFESGRDFGSSGGSERYIMNPDGTDQTRLSRFNCDGTASQPLWCN